MKPIRLNVEALKSQLIAQPTTTNRFRLNIPKDQVRELLYIHYQNEVMNRHRNFIETGDTIKQIDHFADVLTNPESTKFGAYICGTCGNGKTTLLKAFRSMISQLDKCCNLFAEDMEITHSRYDVIIIESRRLAASAQDSDLFQRIKDSNILCIDDCGIEPTESMNYGNVMNPIEEVMEHRWDRQLFTVITTNLKRSEFDAKYGRRVKDRRTDMMETIIFGSESYREQS